MKEQLGSLKFVQGVRTIELSSNSEFNILALKHRTLNEVEHIWYPRRSSDDKALIWSWLTKIRSYYQYASSYEDKLWSIDEALAWKIKSTVNALKNIWPILSSSKETSLSNFRSTFCLCWIKWRTRCIKWQSSYKAKRMQQTILKEAKKLWRIVQQNYPFEAKFSNLEKSLDALKISLKQCLYLNLL